MQTFAQIVHGIKWNYIYMVTDILTKFGFIFSVPVPTFIFPCTHFYFSLPTEKFLRGQGEKYTWAEKDIPHSLIF